jgi:hypothetical protein
VRLARLDAPRHVTKTERSSTFVGEKRIVAFRTDFRRQSSNDRHRADLRAALVSAPGAGQPSAYDLT